MIIYTNVKKICRFKTCGKQFKKVLPCRDSFIFEGWQSKIISYNIKIKFNGRIKSRYK